MSPVKSDEFVPPKVKIPPAPSFVVDRGSARCSQKLISGAASSPLVANACQKGVARVLAMEENASPMIPCTEPSVSSEDT